MLTHHTEKRKAPTTFPNENAIKRIAPTLPTPECVKLDSKNPSIGIYFNTESAIRSYVNLFSERLNNNTLTNEIQEFNPELFLISLTADEFNEYYGQQAFQTLSTLLQYAKSSVNQLLINKLCNLPSSLANVAALMTMVYLGRVKNIIFAHFGEVELKQLKPFFQKLSSETLNQFAKTGISNYYHRGGKNKTQPGVHLLLRADDELDRLTSDTLMGFLSGRYYFGDDSFFRLIVERLSNKSLIALCDKINFNKINPLYIDFGSWIDKASVEFKRYFYSRLSTETKLILYEDGFDDTTFQYSVISEAITNPFGLRSYSQHSVDLKKLAFHDGGNSKDRWSLFAANVISMSPEIKKYRHLSLTLEPVQQQPKRAYLAEMLEQGFTFLRLQGRTILLAGNNGLIRAVKVQKETENERALQTEYEMTCDLTQNHEQFGLRSQLPEPVAFIPSAVNIKSLIQRYVTDKEYRLFAKMIGKERAHAIYVYDVDTTKCDYFTYLHHPSLSVDQYRLANQVAVHDLFTLLKRGIVFNQLADIFHNVEEVGHGRSDAGRYMVLVNLLRWSDMGTGRLTNWQQAVAYPNVRASGIADLGDFVLIDEYISDSKLVLKYFGEVRDIYHSRTGNYLLANVMAEYQYILFLIAGHRGNTLTQQCDNLLLINMIWQALAEQVFDNCVQAVNLMTHVSEKAIRQTLAAVVDVSRLARQMHYWMTKEYIQDVMQGRVRSGIYDNATEVHVDFKRFRSETFNSEIGCSIDGVHQDLGPVNGQEPIKEANKLFYWMVIFIFDYFNKIQLTLRDLKTVRQEKNLADSELLRKGLFTHLPQKEYHKLQFFLCEERLRQRDLPVDMVTEIKQESPQHKVEFAARAIQLFWKNNKPEKNNTNTPPTLLSKLPPL